MKCNFQEEKMMSTVCCSFRGGGETKTEKFSKVRIPLSFTLSKNIYKEYESTQAILSNFVGQGIEANSTFNTLKQSQNILPKFGNFYNQTSGTNWIKTHLHSIRLRRLSPTGLGKRIMGKLGKARLGLS